jgi:hypothetical protein
LIDSTLEAFDGNQEKTIRYLQTNMKHLHIWNGSERMPGTMRNESMLLYIKKKRKERNGSFKKTLFRRG